MSIRTLSRAAVRPVNQPRQPRRWRCTLALAMLGFPAAGWCADPLNTKQGTGALVTVTTGTNDSAFGAYALSFLTTGTNNTAVGDYSLYVNNADLNTAVGQDALSSNKDGFGNVGIGAYALRTGTTGDYSTAVGFEALTKSEADASTALGYEALYANTKGTANTAVGATALRGNTTGISNTSVGYQSLYNNVSGSYNTAVGVNTLYNSGTGAYNTALGYQSLLYTTTGKHNTALGSLAMFYNVGGTSDTALGDSALFNNTSGGFNTALGVNALKANTTGGNNIAVGVNAGSSLTASSYNIDIGNVGVAGEGKTIRIGTPANQSNAYMAGISGVTVPEGVAVVVDTNGHLGTKNSSERFKEAIVPMADASEAILALEPVNFRYKPEYDPAGIAQFGLIAEQVAKVDPNLVARDAEGQIYTVRYDEINAMLLNEFLKEHRKVQAQQDTIVRLSANLDAQARNMEAQQKELRDLAVLVRDRTTPPAP